MSESATAGWRVWVAHMAFLGLPGEQSFHRAALNTSLLLLYGLHLSIKKVKCLTLNQWL